MAFLKYNCKCGFRSMSLPDKAKCPDCGQILIPYFNVLSDDEARRIVKEW